MPRALRAWAGALLASAIAARASTLPRAPRSVPAGSPARGAAAAAADRARIGSLDVPSLGLGTIKWSPGSAQDTARLKRTFDAAMDGGLVFLDSAERYGASTQSLVGSALRAVGVRGRARASGEGGSFGGSGEELLGSFAAQYAEASAAHRHAPRPVLATKFTPVPWRADACSVVDACAASARRLGVDALDLYQIHMPDVIQPFRRFGRARAKDELYWDGLAECVRLGLARNVGVSNYGPTLLRRAHAHLARRDVNLASNQICYSLLYRRQGAQATVDACAELGVTPLAYYPLAMGLLAGAWDAQAPPADPGLRVYFTGDERRGIPPGGATPVVEALRAVAAARGKTPAQVALNWVRCKGAVPIVGASRPEHIDANLGALGWRLAPEEVAVLEAAADACGFEFQGAGFKFVDAKFVGYGKERWALD